ncbi:DNA-binding protein [Glaciecola sp. SC05]|uniref:DNA-binding protein n=1 Tax=Glaciecola sp. SC05 TaxID=1987355 RepID=UPI0035278753
MARHPEIKEKDIIEAGLALEEKGKMPNPGAIRAQLGFRGGLIRIRDVWNKHQAKQIGAISTDEHQMLLEDLPSEIADATEQLIVQQKTQLERLVVCAFQRCQSLFDKRLDDHLSKHNQQMAFYKDYETNVDVSIKKLEDDAKDMQTELKDLAEQNAKLLIENAKLAGQVAAFERALPTPATTQPSLNKAS